MDSSPKRAFSTLASKINAILVAVLGIGLSLAGAAFALSLVTTASARTQANLESESEILYTAIENLMLPGEAPIAVKYFEELQARAEIFRVALFRRDGTMAFIDNDTIERVNQVRGKKVFEPKALPISPVVTPPERPYFDDAVAMPPNEIYFSLDEAGRTYARVYRPLLNLPKCTVCHGGDHTIRGVIDVRTDVSAELSGQRTTVIASSAGMLGLIVVLALLIGAFLRRVVVKPVGEIGRLCASVSAGDFAVAVGHTGGDEIGELGRSFNGMVKGLRERAELTKYISTGTIGALSGDQEPKRVARTLLFTDVRGFTSYTEKHEPEEVVGVLNKLLEVQSAIIHAEGGDIDKFVGDEIVAVFSGADGPARACAAAAGIMRAVASKQAYDGLELGAGIATGQVIEGKVGSERRADFTVIGDPVNVASRLCSKAKARQIIVSEPARKALEATPLIFAGPFKTGLKGKEGEVSVYVLDWTKGGIDGQDR